MNGVTKRPRLDFDFTPTKLASFYDRQSAIHGDYELRRINIPLMDQIRDEVLPYSKNYWRSSAEFERDGVGFCIVHQTAIVSLCYTCFAWNRHQDIDIMTVEGHQRKGLGFAVACAFIDHCLGHSLTPSWDCWSKNRPSVALAEKLGFVPRIEVTTYHGVRP